MTNVAEKRSFLLDMHYFRAFAILNIVLVHIWRLPSGAPSDVSMHTLDIMREVLFHDSTIYFIFISGFLFHYLSHNFNLIKYYRSKICNVVLPYLFVSTCFIFLKIFMFNAFSFSIKGYLSYIVSGSIQLHLWYIPFICVVFAVSPLLLKLPKKFFIVTSILMMLIPLLGTRTGTFISTGQYAFFFPIYCFGITCSMCFDKVVEISKKYFLFFVLSAIVLSAYLFRVQSGDVVVEGVLNAESFYYLQKMALMFVAIRVLQVVKSKKIPAFNVLANFSFAIYFLHVAVWLALGRVFSSVLVEMSNVVGWELLVTLIAFMSLGLTVLIAALTKKVLGRYSRMVIGV